MHAELLRVQIAYWGCRLRALGALGTRVGACGPVGGVKTDELGGSRILEVDVPIYLGKESSSEAA